MDTFTANGTAASNRTPAAYTCLVIALSFFWTGSGYLSWVYHLRQFYPASGVDLIAQVAGYLLQAAGIVIYTVSKMSDVRIRRHSFTLFTISGFLLMCLARFSSSAPVALIFGLAMNLLIGIIGACYLMLLARMCDTEDQTKDRSRIGTGTVFGLAYGAGSILSYLLSLPGGGSFLMSPAVFAVYAVIAAVCIMSYGRAAGGFSDTAPDLEPEETAGNDRPQDMRLIAVAGSTVILLSLVASAGAFFPIASTDSSSISLELSRAFYAVGLIAAGITNDRNRSAGAILCIAALCFPFFSAAAGGSIALGAALRTLGYIFFGFYAVYRVILFIDISDKTGIAFAACFGLMFGRIGDALGAAAGISMAGRPILLISVIAAAFVICIILFFWLYRSLYMQPAASTQDRLVSFASAYGLSQRETQLLEMVTRGASNKDIAAQLFISENTVKFHMRNLLKKTGCSNRADLSSLFSRSSK